MKQHPNDTASSPRVKLFLLTLLQQSSFGYFRVLAATASQFRPIPSRKGTGIQEIGHWHTDQMVRY